MYGIAGERRLDELTVRLVARLRRIAPVRIGNAAAAQFQLDVYGEVIDALHHARLGGLDSECDDVGHRSARCSSISRRSGAEPDEGIWEVRGPAPSFHAFEGDGVGRVRSRGQASSNSG